ncbi:MAG: response regulator transcription factor [Acidobacteria bacterium]|nr:response regulator transcription factor [Acidobacteriota bacterium]MCI0628768.1 response regulator transcription factor [Acidobacteriota bacterium]MCI0718616.1 response regulator transcription factor [Acidobacteriota bacterium]
MGFRVLAVDDEPDVLGLVQTKLQKAGFDVVTATNGQEAVERAVTDKPDLIIMDVMMPKLDGLSACTRIKQEMGEAAPIIILLTARGQEADVLEGLGCGADDYMVKPFAPRELVARVNVALMKAGKSDIEF